MQIVIDIDEKLYAAVTSDFWCGNYAIQQVIKNGTPLPKGHGRLIDADTVLDKMRDTFDMQELYLPIHLKELVIDEMPTIIEADGGKHISGKEQECYE